MIQQITVTQTPQDLTVAQDFATYVVNLFKDDTFIEGRIYKGYSGHMMMNEIYELKRFAGFTSVEW